MRGTAVRIAAAGFLSAALVASMAGPAFASTEVLHSYIVGSGAGTTWVDQAGNDADGYTFTETGLELYYEVIAPQPRVGPAVPLLVAYRYVYFCTAPYVCEDVSLYYGATQTLSSSADWPDSATARGHVTLDPYTGWDFTHAAGQSVTVAFDETWTGTGAIVHSNAGAAVWGVPGVEHHVAKLGPNETRAATLEQRDPFAGALGDLGDLTRARLFNVKLTYQDACKDTSRDANTGACS